MNAIIVGLGGACGAILRYILYELTPTTSFLSYTTVMINSIGSIILGLLFYSFKNHHQRGYLFLTTGFLSGFTTFSTFSSETVSYLLNTEYYMAFTTIGLSLICCIGGCGIGVLIRKVVTK